MRASVVACAVVLFACAASLAQAAPLNVLILTPLKDSAAHLDGFFALLETLSFPHAHIGVAFLESDSNDDGATRRIIQAELPRLRHSFRKALYFQRDFGYALPSADRHGESVQLRRRSVLARSRNSLLTQALDDTDDYVLWLDVDVIAFPADLIEQLLAAGKEIVQPHIKTFDGKLTYDLNAWQETRSKGWYLADPSLKVLFEGYDVDHGRLHMNALQLAGVSPVTLDGLGGAVLLVRGDLHRRGLLFPASPYKKHIETEAFAIKARDWGYQAWGLPMLEVRHAAQAGELAVAMRLERALTAAQGSNSRPHAPIAAGALHTCFAACDGLVHCSGSNAQGQAGRPLAELSVIGFASPVLGSDSVPLAGIVELSAQGSTTCGRRTDGSVFCWGSGFGAVAVAQPALAGAEHLAAGSAAACVITSAGKLRCVGAAGTQLAGLAYDGPFDDVAVLGAETLCVLASNRVLCCGLLFGAIGGNGATAPCTAAPVALVFPASPASFWQSVSGIVSSDNTVFGLFNGTSSVAGWGLGTAGQLGQGNSVSFGSAPNPLATLATPLGTFGATQVATSDAHACIVVNQVLKCIGSNVAGQLGVGGAATVNSFELQSPVAGAVASKTVSYVVTGAAHTCAVLSTAGSEGKVACWGSNSAGQAGLSLSVATAAPTVVGGILTTAAGAACRAFPVALSAAVGPGLLFFNVSSSLDAAALSALGGSAPVAPYHLRWLLSSVANVATFAGVPVVATGTGSGTVRTVADGAVLALSSDLQPYALAGAAPQTVPPFTVCWRATSAVTNRTTIGRFQLKAFVGGAWVDTDDTCTQGRKRGVASVVQSDTVVCSQLCLVNVQLQIFETVPVEDVGELPVPEPGQTTDPTLVIEIPGTTADGPATVVVVGATVDELIEHLTDLGLIVVTNGVQDGNPFLEIAAAPVVVEPGKPVPPADSSSTFKVRVMVRRGTGLPVPTTEPVQLVVAVEVCVSVPAAPGNTEPPTPAELLAEYDMFVFDPVQNIYVSSLSTCPPTTNVTRTAASNGTLCSGTCLLNTDGYVLRVAPPIGTTLSPSDVIAEVDLGEAALTTVTVSAPNDAVAAIFAALLPTVPGGQLVFQAGVPDVNDTTMFGVPRVAPPPRTSTLNIFGLGLVLALKQTQVPQAGSPFATTLGGLALVIASPVQVCWEASATLVADTSNATLLTEQLQLHYSLLALIGGEWVPASNSCAASDRTKSVVGNTVCTNVCWLNAQYSMAQTIDELPPATLPRTAAAAPVSLVVASVGELVVPSAAIASVYALLAPLLGQYNQLFLQLVPLPATPAVQNALSVTLELSPDPLKWQKVVDLQAAVVLVPVQPVAGVGQIGAPLPNRKRAQPAFTGLPIGPVDPYQICWTVPDNVLPAAIASSFKFQAFVEDQWVDASRSCLVLPPVIAPVGAKICTNICYINIQVRVLTANGIARDRQTIVVIDSAPYHAEVSPEAARVIFDQPGLVSINSNVNIKVQTASLASVPESSLMSVRDPFELLLFDTNVPPQALTAFGNTPVFLSSPAVVCYTMPSSLSESAAQLRVLDSTKGLWVSASTLGSPAGATCGLPAPAVPTPQTRLLHSQEKCFWVCALNTVYAFFEENSVSLIGGLEDFSTGFGTTPPYGWTNKDLSPAPYQSERSKHRAYAQAPVSELWSFDNAGGLRPLAPIVEPFAAFDAFFLSNGNSHAENVALISPQFDTVAYSRDRIGERTCIIVTGDHWIAPGVGSSGFIEVRNPVNGNRWTVAARFDDYSANPASFSIDISRKVLAVDGNPALGSRGIQVRWRWESTTATFFWVIDNIQITAQPCSQIGA